jgi:hypothetical protein
MRKPDGDMRWLLGREGDEGFVTSSWRLSVVCWEDERL